MKRLLPAAWLAILALVAGLPAHASGAGPTGRPLKVSISGWENNLTPFTVTFASQPSTSDLLNLVYDTLFWSQATPDPEPWLAEKADPSPDRKSWTVQLRSGVKWHDGRPFSAEDVKFTFEYFKQHADKSGRYGHHVADLPIFLRAQIMTPTQLRLFFDQPVPTFKVLPGGDLPMLPKHVWQTIDDPLKAVGDRPIGTGPYQVSEMVPRERYTLKANPDYFKGKPLRDEVELPVVNDVNVAFNDLVAGKLDLVSRTVPPIFVGQLTANPQLSVVKATRLESLQLNFNARKQPLSDPKLRKAISLAIDTRVLNKTVLSDRGRPGVDSFIHPASAWALPGARHEFDVGKANEILDAAGYSRKDPDGIRRGPDGKRLEFTALFSTLEPQSLQALQIVSQMTTGIGVRMEPEPAAPAELRAVRRARPGGTPVYDAYVSELELHAHSDPDALYFFFHSPGKGMGAQITGYSNPTFDRLVEEAATTVSVKERKRKLNEAQSIFAEEVPSLALFYPDAVYAFRPAAYDGWVPDPGHGLLTKRSFLEDYARSGAGGGPADRIAPAWLFLGGVAALVLLGSALVLFRRPPAPLPEELDELEEESPAVALTRSATSADMDEDGADMDEDGAEQPAGIPASNEQVPSAEPAAGASVPDEAASENESPAEALPAAASAARKTPNAGSSLELNGTGVASGARPPEWPGFAGLQGLGVLEETPKLPPTAEVSDIWPATLQTEPGAPEGPPPHPPVGAPPGGEVEIEVTPPSEANTPGRAPGARQPSRPAEPELAGESEETDEPERAPRPEGRS